MYQTNNVDLEVEGLVMVKAESQMPMSSSGDVVMKSSKEEQKERVLIDDRKNAIGDALQVIYLNLELTSEIDFQDLQDLEESTFGKPHIKAALKLATWLTSQ